MDIQTVLRSEHPVPSTTKVDTLPKHGKRTVFNDSSASESKDLNISNGHCQKFESEDTSEKATTVHENALMDVSSISPIVNGKTKKMAPNQKSISCEDFLLEAEYCEKPKPKVIFYNAILM